jgi:heat shock protein HtpX
MRGMNQFKTTALLGLLSGLIVLAGYYLIGNEQGLILGLIFAAFTSVGSWYYSDRAALAAYRAQPLAREQAPELFGLIERLCQRAEIPVPTIFIVPTKSPNAFATGRDPNHAAVAVTEGILELLSEEELAGVLAHELTHVKNRDTLTQAVAGTLAGGITFLGRILSFGALYGPVTYDNRRNPNPLGLLFLIVLAPVSAGLIQLAISRTREYAADQGAAEITGNPLGLVNAPDSDERQPGLLAAADCQPDVAGRPANAVSHPSPHRRSDSAPVGTGSAVRHHTSNGLLAP